MKGSANIENLIVLILKSVEEESRMDALDFLGENAFCCVVYNEDSDDDGVDVWFNTTETVKEVIKKATKMPPDTKYYCVGFNDNDIPGCYACVALWYAGNSVSEITQGIKDHWKTWEGPE